MKTRRDRVCNSKTEPRKENLPSFEQPLVEELKNVVVSDKCLGPDDFELLKLVGKGGYGKVFQAQKKDDKQIFALKVVKRPTKKIDLKHLYDEKKILETVKSPFLCEMHYSFEVDKKLYLVLEFLSGGELFTLLNREERLNEDASRFYLAEMTLALEHLHDNDVIYRDLKPDNIMLDKNGHIKLTDFGLSKFNVPKGKSTSTFCGTIEYMAPEIVNKSAYGHSVDIWALGIVMYDMLTGGPPFYGETEEEQIDNIRRGKVRMPSNLSDGGKAFLRSLLIRIPHRRIAIPEIKNLEFFKIIDWEKLRARDFEPPFKPNLENELDVSQFDTSFTDLPPEDSPFKPMKVEDQNDPFVGFDCQCSETKKKKQSEPKSKSSAARKLVVEHDNETT
uniref:Non-specific serine/threonine protein kinase n=1 Tax=Caenorhabditis tropicalis TaxID=1561998 RepID=A0A1I7TLV3_9PELO